jgi:hypothetical protein
MTDTRASLGARIDALIDRLADGGRDDAARDALLVALARHQIPRIEPWARLAAARGIEPGDMNDVAQIPALPTDVYRHARVAVHPGDEDLRVFRTSGTTGGPRGAHPLRTLAFYDRAARAAARHALFPDVDQVRLVVLAPDAPEAPDSSLSYMLARFTDWFGAGTADGVWRGGRLQVEALTRALHAHAAGATPVALVGTSFAFVHAEDALGDERFALPPGSRIMHTGGFKGRSREVAPEALRDALALRYGVPHSHVVLEYGMTELCSQMYEDTLRAALAGGPSEPGWLWVPGWVRAAPVHPETLQPVPEGTEGILRIDDLANVDTPCSIQTADRAVRRGTRVLVLGRDASATPRGCSLAVDEALGGTAP